MAELRFGQVQMRSGVPALDFPQFILKLLGIKQISDTLDQNVYATCVYVECVSCVLACGSRRCKSVTVLLSLTGRCTITYPLDSAMRTLGRY